jgi:hypothetical protein
LAVEIATCYQSTQLVLALGDSTSLGSSKVVAVIREFPPDHELLAFFDSEPVVLSPDDPWFYNTLEFTTVREEIRVRCRLIPSYGKITTQLMMNGHELAKFELRDVETIRIIVNARQEALVATFAPALRLDNFALQLKPRVWAAWGNLHQFP